MRASKGVRWLTGLGAMAVVGLGAGLALASEAGGHHVTGPNLDLVWRAMNFAVLAIVLVVVLRKPLKAGLSGRVEQIKNELAELEAKREEAKRRYAEIEQRLKDAEGEREKILAEFRALGEREKEKILANARQMAERIKAQAQFTIEQETAAAKAELKREIADMSAALAEDLLKQNITAEDHTRLVSEYLAKVQREVQ
ncbi:MAG: F0F1 ATP synthase subunit B [Desulfarculus sp.]|nr:F0F1 ATP synthase subunit B [Desulfarculus sp.]